jgi:rRNA pseudouridine-1189 N-methylase Emg1 (Nep1/Mra1 family)
MNNLSNRNPENSGHQASSKNSLWQYVQSMNPETVMRLSHPSSDEVVQSIERSIFGMLGALPEEDFDVTITTSRENLGKLLASAMINGYFLRNAEQRLEFEQSLELTDTSSSPID